MKRKESEYAIKYDIGYSPIFGNNLKADLLIGDHCIKEDSCSIHNDGTRGYECHPEYKSSLFVNTAGPNEINQFSVLDYEVYCIDNYKDYIYNACKYPDIIWEYTKTKKISNKSLQIINSEEAIIDDLDVIHCKDSNIRLKISRYYFKNPSEYLPKTQIVY